MNPPHDVDVGSLGSVRGIGVRPISSGAYFSTFLPGFFSSGSADSYRIRLNEYPANVTHWFTRPFGSSSGTGSVNRMQIGLPRGSLVGISHPSYSSVTPAAVSQSFTGARLSEI